MRFNFSQVSEDGRMGMELNSETIGNALLVTVCEPRIDAAVAIQFKDRMREVSDGGPDRVILDMSSVSFLDSSGLGAVVAVMKFLGKDRSFELAGLTPTVAKVFRLTRMDSIFTIHPDVETAMSPLANAS
jgi:anti-sigma B factor antagonist